MTCCNYWSLPVCFREMDTVSESPELKRIHAAGTESLILLITELSGVGSCFTSCNIPLLWCVRGWVGPLPPRNPQVTPSPSPSPLSGLCFGSETHSSEIRVFWWVRQGSPGKKSVNDEKLPKLRKWLKAKWGAMETEGGLPVINRLSVWLEVFLKTHLPDIYQKQNLLLKMGQRFVMLFLIMKKISFSFASFWKWMFIIMFLSVCCVFYLMYFIYLFNLINFLQNFIPDRFVKRFIFVAKVVNSYFHCVTWPMWMLLISRRHKYRLHDVRPCCET